MAKNLITCWSDCLSSVVPRSKRIAARGWPELFMRPRIPLIQHAHGQLIGALETAVPLLLQVEAVLPCAADVVFDFSGIEVTQSANECSAMQSHICAARADRYVVESLPLPLESHRHVTA